MTQQQRKVIKLIVQHQIAYPEEKGISASDLLNLCIEQMIIMSNRDLKQQLQEAKDHKVVIEKMEDTQTMYYMPFPGPMLDNILKNELQDIK